MSVGPCPPDPCGTLLQEMLDFIANLQKRFLELKANKGNLPMTKPSIPDPTYGLRSIEGERHQFNGRQQGLRNRMQKYEDNGCGDPPPEALEWATKPVPTADPKPAPDGNANRVLEDVVGFGVAVGIGYVIYRGIRMIPSFAPPLWWTIPLNLATP